MARRRCSLPEIDDTPRGTGVTRSSTFDSSSVPFDRCVLPQPPQQRPPSLHRRHQTITTLPSARILLEENAEFDSEVGGLSHMERRASIASRSTVERESTEIITAPCNQHGHSGTSSARAGGKSLTLDASSSDAKNNKSPKQYTPIPSVSQDMTISGILGQLPGSCSTPRTKSRALTIDTSCSDGKVREQCASADASPTGAWKVHRQTFGRAAAPDTFAIGKESNKSRTPQSPQSPLSSAAPKSSTLPQLSWPSTPQRPHARRHSMPTNIARAVWSEPAQHKSDNQSAARKLKRVSTVTSAELDALFEQEIAAMYAVPPSRGVEDIVVSAAADPPLIEEAWETMLRSQDEEDSDFPEFTRKVISGVKPKKRSAPDPRSGKERNRTSMVQTIGRVAANLARLRKRALDNDLLMESVETNADPNTGSVSTQDY